jgi:capsule polysaccharide export protein KpsC/LpsZ
MFENVSIRKLSKLTNLKRIAKQSLLKLFKMAVIISQDLLNPMVLDLMSTFP